MEGVVRPRTTGAQVSLRKLSAGAWKSVASVSTNEQGAFTFAIDGQGRQVARYQILVDADQIWRQVAAPVFSIILL